MQAAYSGDCSTVVAIFLPLGRAEGHTKPVLV